MALHPLPPPSGDPSLRALHPPPRGVAVFALLLLAGFAAELFAQAGLLPGGGVDELVERHGLVPREWLRAISGASPPSMARLLSPLTAIFLHAGPLHLGVNLAVLWLVGPPVEGRVGTVGVAGLLLGTAVLGAGAAVAADPTAFAPLVGASGAVAGLVGAALGLRCLGGARRAAAGLVAALEVGTLALGGVGRLGTPAHLAGLLGGLLAGLLLGRRGART